MFRSIKYFFSSLSLKNVGLIEILFALTPMLSGFGLGNIPLSALMWVLLLTAVFIRYGRLPMKNFKPLTYFVIFWMVHTFALLTTRDVNINSIIVQVLYFLSVYTLSPVLNLKKLEGSLNWIALISIAGLLYQWSIIAGGGSVHPLEIPGLSMAENRILELSERPSSFFMEPQAYVFFMWMPLSLALLHKNFIWVAVISLSIFLTTSTTGLITTFLMIGAYTLTQRSNKKVIIVLVAFAATLFLMLTNLDAFQGGVDKLNNTDADNNVRLAQGLYIVSTMKGSDFVFGSGAVSAYDYCINMGRASNVIIYGDSVYIPTFWYLLLIYGVIGLLLYLLTFLSILKISKHAIPYLSCVLATLFSDPTCIGNLYAIQLVYLLTIVNNKQSIEYESCTH